MLFPVTSFICDTIPVNARKTTTGELFYTDVEQLAPQEVAQLYEVSEPLGLVSGANIC